MKFCLTTSDSFGPIRRATISLGPPAALGTTISTGRCGSICARSLLCAAAKVLASVPPVAIASLKILFKIQYLHIFLFFTMRLLRNHDDGYFIFYVTRLQAASASTNGRTSATSV